MLIKYHPDQIQYRMDFLKKFGYEKPWYYLCRPLKECRVGQGVKTPPFHGGITGSIPVRGTTYSLFLTGFFHIRTHCLELPAISFKQSFEPLKHLKPFEPDFLVILPRKKITHL